MATHRRLINVSNRLPVSIKKTGNGMRVDRSSGGLATALEGVRQEQQGVWIGWSGAAEDQPIKELLERASRRRPYELQGVVLSSEEVDKFYAGFTNEIIWPLFHDMPTRCNFDPDYWEIYQKVNRKFAVVAAERAREDDFLWVHDYHLMMVGCNLRQLGKHVRTGFFLHIPFPSPDIFEQLPWRDSILQCMLDFDVVGFQTDRYRNNFFACLKSLFPDVSIETGGQNPIVTYRGRQTVAGTFPISIDFQEFAQRAARAEVASRAATVRQEFLENVLVLGVDRLDYTKGIPERLKAFRLLLRRFPELRRQITLAQVVVPSREDIPRYKELRHDIELLVSQINGEFTERGWVPVHYMHRHISRDELLAYYRAADIALITPLKDGMNLVAKEFCAAQVDERGVVIISEFAGARDELQHGAILVNPNDIAGVAQALRDATLMPQEERSTRMRLLRNIVREHNVQRWAESFLQAAASVTEQPASAAGGPLKPRLVPEKQPGQNVPGVALIAAPPVRTAGRRIV
jgi:alpha,alpha-trehalose-phosphate synthase [UDP-forming]